MPSVVNEPAAAAGRLPIEEARKLGTATEISSLEKSSISAQRARAQCRGRPDGLIGLIPCGGGRVVPFDNRFALSNWPIRLPTFTICAKSLVATMQRGQSKMDRNLIPFFVCHYTPEKARRSYIKGAWCEQRGQAGFRLKFITRYDREEPSVAKSYVYREQTYREMVEPIRNLLIGYWWARDHVPFRPFDECVQLIQSRNASLDQDFATFPWLRPKSLSLGEVSLCLKHREAWTRIAQSDSEYGIVAEDDIIFTERSLAYLSRLLTTLPQDADYVDIAGGCGLTPRVGNKCINGFFYEMQPPRDRTTRAIIVRRSFVRQLIELAPPLCLHPDWTLTWAFAQLRSKVYWVEPTVFGHGSMMQRYRSSLATERDALAAVSAAKVNPVTARPEAGFRK